MLSDSICMALEFGLGLQPEIIRISSTKINPNSNPNNYFFLKFMIAHFNHDVFSPSLFWFSPTFLSP